MPKLASTASRIVLPALLAGILLLAALFLPDPASTARVKPNTKVVAAKPGVDPLGRLEPTALRRWPDSFGGIWLDSGKVFIAFTGRGKRRVDRLGNRFPNPKRLRAVTVDDSLRSLEALQAQMIADRQFNPVMDSDPGSGRPIRIAYDLNIDIQGNVVEAIVDRPITQTLVNAFAQRYGGDVVVRRAPLMEPNACNSRQDCAPLLRSGLEIAGSGTICSSAFNVYYPPYPGPGSRPGILSAGHCGEPSHDLTAERTHNGVVYGQVVFDRWEGPLDLEIHSVGNGLDSSAPWIYASPSNREAQIKNVGTYEGLVEGQQVCMSGRTSGQECGKVLDKAWAPGGAKYPADAQNYIRASFCSDDGDSGAGVYRLLKRGVKGKTKSKFQAVGVHSGSNIDGVGGNCADPLYGAIFGHIEFILEAYPLSVNAVPF